MTGSILAVCMAMHIFGRTFPAGPPGVQCCCQRKFLQSAGKAIPPVQQQAAAWAPLCISQLQQESWRGGGRQAEAAARVGLGQAEAGRDQPALPQAVLTGQEGPFCALKAAVKGFVFAGGTTRGWECIDFAW